MGLKVITPAAAQMTAEDVRLHTRVGSTSEDSLFDAWILEAQGLCEHMTGRAIGAQTLELALDGFPVACDAQRGFRRPHPEPIALPSGPVAAITLVTYVDPSGAPQTLAPSGYVLDDYGLVCKLYPAPGAVWPDCQPGVNSVKVRYTAGFFPPAVRSAMCLIVAHRYENREASSGLVLTEIPLGVQELLDTIKDWSRESQSAERWRT